MFPSHHLYSHVLCKMPCGWKKTFPKIQTKHTKTQPQNPPPKKKQKNTCWPLKKLQTRDCFACSSLYALRIRGRNFFLKVGSRSQVVFGSKPVLRVVVYFVFVWFLVVIYFCFMRLRNFFVCICLKKCFSCVVWLLKWF